MLCTIERSGEVHREDLVAEGGYSCPPRTPKQPIFICPAGEWKVEINLKLSQTLFGEGSLAGVGCAIEDDILKENL